MATFCSPLLSFGLVLRAFAPAAPLPVSTDALRLTVAAAALAALRWCRGWLLLSLRRLMFALLRLSPRCTLLRQQLPPRRWILLRLSLRGLVVVARGPMKRTTVGGVDHDLRRVYRDLVVVVS